jgi:thiamine-phosphate pyrophosphorylase
MTAKQTDKKAVLQNVQVCVITDRHLSRGRSFVDVVEAAIQGGAQMVQFRDKELPDGLFFREAMKLRALTRKAGILFIIDDRVDVALGVAADGVHLGEKDLPIEEVRKLVGSEIILGASARTRQAAQRAQERGADYLGVGAIFPTGTKDDAVHVGIERLTHLRPLVHIPILAIGGITAHNAAQAIRAGADGVAVISAVVGADEVASATARLLDRVRRAKETTSQENS